MQFAAQCEHLNRLCSQKKPAIAGLLSRSRSVFKLLAQLMRVAGGQWNRREIFVEQSQMLNRFLKLQISFAAQRLITIKQLHIQIAAIEQFESTSAQVLGLFEHLTVTFQGEVPGRL